MIVYLQYSEWSLVLEYIADNFDASLPDLLAKKAVLPLERRRFLGWNDLEIFVAQISANIFDEEQKQGSLIDIEELKFSDSEFVKIVENIEAEDVDIILFSSTKEKLLADEKKVLKKAKIDFVELKKADEKYKNQILEEYQDDGLELSYSDKKLINKNVNNYTELLNILDLLLLVDKPQEILKGYFAEESLPVFMLPFSLKNLEKNAKTWKKRIAEEDIQLALSLVYGKLDKQETEEALQIQKTLIKTDQRIKTRGGVSPLIWWKYFLWGSIFSQKQESLGK